PLRCEHTGNPLPSWLFPVFRLPAHPRRFFLSAVWQALSIACKPLIQKGFKLLKPRLLEGREKLDGEVLDPLADQLVAHLEKQIAGRAVVQLVRLGEQDV